MSGHGLSGKEPLASKSWVPLWEIWKNSSIKIRVFHSCGNTSLSPTSRQVTEPCEFFAKSNIPQMLHWYYWIVMRREKNSYREIVSSLLRLRSFFSHSNDIMLKIFCWKMWTRLMQTCRTPTWMNWPHRKLSQWTRRRKAQDFLIQERPLWSSSKLQAVGKSSNPFIIAFWQDCAWDCSQACGWRKLPGTEIIDCVHLQRANWRLQANYYTFPLRKGKSFLSP